MALPASRRPKYAEELLRQESEKLQKDLIKVKISRSHCVLASVGEWYLNIAEKERKRLNAKRLKRRVLAFCYKMHFDYEKLPDDWLDTLKKEHKVVIVEKQKNIKKEPVEIDRKLEYDFGDDSSSEDEPLGEDIMDGIKSRNTSGSFNSLKDAMLVEPEPVRETRSAKRKYEVEMSESASTSTSPPEESKNVPKQKRWVDLTNEPPPDFWLEAASRNITLPRNLCFYSAPDLNIVFYKYESTEVPENETNTPVAYTGFNWWKGKD